MPSTIKLCLACLVACQVVVALGCGDGQQLDQHSEVVDPKSDPQNPSTRDAGETPGTEVDPGEALPEVAIQGPVLVRMTVDEANSSESELALTIAVECEFGWHVYAQVSDKISMQPTRVELMLPGGIRVIEEVKRPRGKPNRNQPGSLIYDGLTTFRCRIERPAVEKQVACQVTFQACDDSTCLMPTTVKVGIRVGG